MPANFCLLPQYADDLRDKLASGALNVAELSRMGSAERRAALADVIGDANAQHVNAAFESKLLLQNQKEGLARWVKETTQGKPELARGLLARVQRMDRVLTPRGRGAFLEDLARQKLGFGVTMDEAGKIAELSKTAADARAAVENGTGDRLAYGRAKVAFGNYVAELKAGTPQPLTVGRAITKTAGFAKAFKASFDNSALLRQGWKTLFSHPEIWAKNAKQSFVDMAQQFGGKAVLDEVQADITSRPNALNGTYQKAGLAVGTTEEQFPSALPAKVPLVGRAYKATEAAFTGFLHRTRADVFDKYFEIAKASGVDVADRAQLHSIGKLVNSLTARGHLGPVEPAANTVNALLFSPRALKSNWDFLTAHQLESGVTPFVRKQAAINLVKVIAGTAGVLGIAHTIAPGSVEWDPRSSNFGKIRVGATRFDVTGGISSLATLGARLALMSTKSTTTGTVTKINSGKFGAETGTDVVNNFLENKLSPAASVVKDLLNEKDVRGQKLSVSDELLNAAAPFPLANAVELSNDPKATPASVVLGTLADALGLAQTTTVKHPTGR